MKKMTAMGFAAVMATMFSGGAFAQDAPANMMVSVPGLNLQIGAPVKDDLLAGTEKFAQGASKVTEINLNPSTMGMAGRTYSPEGDLTKKMKLIVVHTYAYDKPGMYRTEDVDAYVKKLEDGSWTCPIVSREKEKDQERLSYICAKSDSDQTNEMVILSAEPQKLTFIHMAGMMSLNDLTHMSDRANGLGRQIGHGGNQFDPQVFVQQQQHLQDQQQRIQELNRRLSTAPKAATPSAPAVPPVPPAQ